MMENKLREYTILWTATIKDALKKIDKNRNGFLIVLNNGNEVLGTLTDGDIRRFIMKENKIESSIENVFHREYKYLLQSEEISSAMELFKSTPIKFLPIIDEGRKLVNILTKQQLHSLLLLDKHVDFTYDFKSFDENIVDYEIFKKPWGFYKTAIMNEYFQAKIISVDPEQRLSLQSHSQREEYWIVAHGTGQAQIGESLIALKSGSSLFIPKGCKHRLINTDSTENLIVIEVQIGNYFGEDDIIRYDDLYGRK